MNSLGRMKRDDLRLAAEIALFARFLFYRRRYAQVSPKSGPMQLEKNEEGFLVDAGRLSELLNVSLSDVQPLMRGKEITSLCERGEGEHAGRYRLTFFYKSRRARLDIDESGQVIRRSIIDFGDRHLPSSAHRSTNP